jgi:hypothetical protein
VPEHTGRVRLRYRSAGEALRYREHASFARGKALRSALQELNRQARLIELDPIYCDQTVRRWQKLTGGKAVQAVTGVAFDHANRSRNADGCS